MGEGEESLAGANLYRDLDGASLDTTIRGGRCSLIEEEWKRRRTGKA